MKKTLHRSHRTEGEPEFEADEATPGPHYAVEESGAANLHAHAWQPDPNVDDAYRFVCLVCGEVKSEPPA